MTACSGIILAAGFGTRMKSRTPKMLFPLLGRSLLDYPLSLLESMGCDPIVVVVGAGADEVQAQFAGRNVTWALQDPPRGTGDATLIGLKALGSAADGRPTMILNGDLPLISTRTLEEMLSEHQEQEALMTLLTLDLADPQGYGRIVRSGGTIRAVVEQADATSEETQINEVNGGLYMGDPAVLRAGLEAMEANAYDNAQGEFYFPPVIGPVSEQGPVCGWRLPSDRSWELQQVNNRVELAEAAAIRKEAILRELCLDGVTIVDPSSTWIEEDVSIGQDTTIHPFTVIRSGVRIGERCQVGPFTHLRVGTDMNDDAEVGNFTEVKNTSMGAGAKAKHLSYLGNGQVGQRVNIGAGTIFANYDGKAKHLTEVGDDAFLGSGTILVAPANVGPGGSTGAGAVVPAGRVVPAGKTVVGVPAKLHEPGKKKGDSG